MQYSYSSVAIAAFGLSTVFAAPAQFLAKKDLVSDVTSLPIVSTIAADATPIVGGLAGSVVGDLESLPIAGSVVSSVVDDAVPVVASVASIVKRAGVYIRQLSIVNGLVGGVTSEVEPIVAGVESEVASLPVVGALVPKAASPVDVIVAAVESLATSIVVDLSTISRSIDPLKISPLIHHTATVVGTDVVDSVVPTVQTALSSIGATLNSTVLTIVPAVTGTVFPLVGGEVEALVSAISQVQTIVSDIEAALLPLVGSVAGGKLSSSYP
jgi:hypothetical protein